MRGDAVQPGKEQIAITLEGANRLKQNLRKPLQ